MADRTDDIAKGVGRSHDTVLGERASLSATVSAKPCDGHVKMQIGGITLGQFVRMVGYSKGIVRPRQRRKAHLVFCHEDGSVTGLIGQRHPARVLMVARILWLGERYKLFLHVVLPVDANHLPRLAVRIVVHRSPAVIAQMVLVITYFYGIPQFGQCQ